MALESVSGALISASLKLLFDALASREVKNFFHAKRLNETLLDRLKTTLNAAGAVVDAAEYEQFTNPSVKSWLDDLRDAVYRANDLLDEISTKDAAQKQVTKIFSRAFHGRKMRKNITEITDRLESIMKLKDDLGLEYKVREMPSWLQSSWRPPTTSLPEEDVYGRNEAKDSVIKILLDDNEDSTLSVIPIVGMGGIGKTTLARLVYNDDKVKEEFNPKAWVCVSEKFDISKITKAILQAVTRDHCNMEDLDTIQCKLEESLSGKKFLIILDDVWNEDYNKWDDLQKLFLCGAKGSKILLTTRNEEIASIVRRNSPTYLVQQLSEEVSWLLFTKHASMDDNVSSNLEESGKEIVKKCKGLPLAIKALAGLMRTKKIEDWNSILKNNLWEECKILPALAISYLYLPPHLKQCFVYCSLFPKGHEFEKEELIRLWMAEGFLQSTNKEMRMEEVGHVNFDALVSRSFFQCSTNIEGHFIMHDLMHDLSIFCAGEFYHRLQTSGATYIPKRTRYLSYDARNATMHDIEALCAVKAESLRSIVVHKGFPWEIKYKMKTTDVDRLLLKFKLLKVLFIVGCKDEVLPNSIGELMFLRYLNLSYSKFKRLPESLCNLSNLQTLELGNNTLPKGINKLENLRYLPQFVVSKDGGANLGELGGLPNISTLLSVWRMENVWSCKDALEAKMMDKTFIEELQLHWSRTRDVMNDLERHRDILDKLRPHSNLKVLKIEGYRGTRFPNWLRHRSYQNIVYISLWRCNNCCVLPRLGQLPSLKVLSIRSFKKLVNVGDEFYKTSNSPLTASFPSLEFLEICYMDVLQEWSSTEIEAFPKLQHVRFEGCRKLIRCCIPAKQMEFTDCPELEFSKHQCYDSLESLRLYLSCESISSFAADTFPSLKELTISERMKLEDGCFLKDGLLPPCLSFLTLSDLWDLETVDLEAFGHLTSLQQLHIKGCPGLKKSEVERLAPLVTKIKIDRCGISSEEVQHLSNVDVLL